MGHVRPFPSFTPEVWTSLHPALALAKSLKRNDALLPILWGLMFNVLCVGRVAESLPWAEEMLDIAKATGDADLLITGHTLASACYFWMGDLIKALEHRVERLRAENVGPGLDGFILESPGIGRRLPFDGAQGERHGLI